MRMTKTAMTTTRRCARPGGRLNQANTRHTTQNARKEHHPTRGKKTEHRSAQLPYSKRTTTEMRQMPEPIHHASVTRLAHSHKCACLPALLLLPQLIRPRAQHLLLLLPLLRATVAAAAVLLLLLLFAAANCTSFISQSSANVALVYILLTSHQIKL